MNLILTGSLTKRRNFVDIKHYDISNLEPQIACPHNVDNVKPVSEVEGTKLDQIFVGSCTNGRFEDIKIMADIMGDEPVAKGVRLLVVPASRTEYMKLLRAGYLEKLMTQVQLSNPHVAAPVWVVPLACLAQEKLDSQLPTGISKEGKEALNPLCIFRPLQLREPQL